MEHEEIQNSTDAILEINKKKKDFKIELALFFILGFLVGITLKTEASKRITIGFEDYKIKAAKESYDVSDIKRRLTEEAKKAQEAESAIQQENFQEIPSGDGIENGQQ